MIETKEFRYIRNLWEYVEDTLNELEIPFLVEKKYHQDSMTLREYSAHTGEVTILIRVECSETNTVEHSTAISSMLKKLGLKIPQTKIEIDIHEKQNDEKVDTPESLRIYELFQQKFSAKTLRCGA